jgi:protein transport protein SEC13
MDYYGKRLATASSDRTVRVFDVAGQQQQLIAELKGHEGPVWQVAWGHPKFGSLLATCSYDRKVIIWCVWPRRGGISLFVSRSLF